MILATATLLAPALVHASVHAPDSSPLVALGQPVQTCGWPSVVAVVGTSTCTGTLIHPQIVIYSASCGGDEDKRIRFGEDASAPGREVAAESCARLTGAAEGWAYCRLAEPITDLPITPPAFGCELDMIESGTPAAIVGFGATQTLAAGRKHWAASSIVAIDHAARAFSLATDDSSPYGCDGDAGAPVFVELDDGWRMVGGMSAISPDCDAAGGDQHNLVRDAIVAIQLEADLDLTPCHSFIGTWEPGPVCAGFHAQSADTGVGTWDDGCLGTAVSGAADGCGPAWDEQDPTVVPELSISSPDDGATYVAGQTIHVWAEAQRQQGGFALRRLSVTYDGELIGTREWEHFFLSPSLLANEGVHTIAASVEDWAGNIVTADPVTISVEARPTIDLDPHDDGPVGCAVIEANGARGGSLAGLACFGLLVLVGARPSVKGRELTRDRARSRCAARPAAAPRARV